MAYPALALLEFAGIASGIEAGDAMVKHAPIAQIMSGTVQPGHYIVLVIGDVAPVEEAFKVGCATGAAALRDCLFLPNVHPGVVAALSGDRLPSAGDALGIIETASIPTAVRAADAGLKGADVTLVKLRLGDGLGGKGLALFTGLVADVEAAVAISSAESGSHLLQQRVIAQLHDEMRANIEQSGRFGDHFNWRAV
jgi:microcompartment protein CcmL/EutN